MSRKGANVFGYIIIVFAVALVIFVSYKLNPFDSKDEASMARQDPLTNYEQLLRYAEGDLRRNIVYYYDVATGTCFAVHGVSLPAGYLIRSSISITHLPCTEWVMRKLRIQKKYGRSADYRFKRTPKPLGIKIPVDGEPIQFELEPSSDTHDPHLPAGHADMPLETAVDAGGQ